MALYWIVKSKYLKKHLDALEILRKKNIKIGIATGRPYYLALDLMAKIKPDLPTISVNGNLILDQNNNNKIYSIKAHSQN